MELPIDILAQALDLQTSTVDRWIRQGRIPVQKSGNNCYFRKPTLVKWARTHHLPFVLTDENASDKDEKAPETLVGAIQRGGIYTDLAGNSVETALKAATERMNFLEAPEKKVLVDRLLEREKLTSTGIGNGVAIPHPRTPLVDSFDKPVIAACFLEHPVDFAAVDDQPVFVMFILISPSVKMHLHLLSRLSYCLRNQEFIGFLKQVPDPDLFLSRMSELEQFMDSPTRR
jgi:PTS system nitrogen regulatory IIA component